MKKSLLNVAAMLSLSMMLMAVSASAQMTRELTVAIPFAFTAGKATLPAGDYTVYSTSTTGQMLLRSSNGEDAVLIMTRSIRRGQPADTANLEFRRYGGQYFLAQVWTKGEQIGRRLAPSRREREAVKEASRHLAKNDAAPEVVSIAVQ